MRCIRCLGLMVKEWLYDHGTERHSLEAYRCVNCGHVQEHGMMMNRKKVQHDTRLQA